MHANGGKWDTSYEWKAVLLLSIGFGLVGIDRYMIMPLFPIMMQELNFDYQDLGYISGALAVAWGIASIFMGNLSDRIGARKVIIPAMLLFSMLCALSGFATGFASLILIRVVMGLTEGAYTPVSIVATTEASKPTRRGRNVGIQMAMLPLFGLGLSPIIVTQLLKVVSWHWIFAMAAVPGFVVAFLLYRSLREKASVEATPAEKPASVALPWYDIFRSRNIVLNVVGMFCWLTCLVVLGAFFPSYLTDYLHLSIEQMGFVLSGLGFGGACGTLIMPGLSDRIGRKPVMLICVVGAFAALVLLAQTDATAWKLFLYVFMTIFFVFSLMALTVGPISTESVPPQLMATAAGLVGGIGEVFGGGVAPAIAGYVAHNYGIQYILHLAIGALCIGFLAALALKETAPLRSGETTPVAA